MRELLAYGTSAPIGRITSFSAKFTDAPLAEGKFETYLHERENAKKPRAVSGNCLDERNYRPAELRFRLE